MIRFYIPFAGLMLFMLPLSGQQTAKSTLLDEIAFQADVMVNATADQHRARAHEAMVRELDSLLTLPDSYSISFDSIPWLSVLHGDDFRLVTWQWRVNDEQYKYGGFIQWADRIVRFNDNRPFINGSGYNSYSASAWYGALYYQIIAFQHDGLRYYLVLGFNAENSSINTKVADILDVNGPEPKLGLPFFIGQEEPLTRIIISYADVSAVHIRYDPDLGGIIYEHVENLTGVGDNGEALPVSDGSLEGWILKDGNWVYQEKVYDIKVDEPPMLDSRKNWKEDKDILGRPRKN